MKTNKPKIKIVFPNLLLAFVPFTALWCVKVFSNVKLDWWTVTSPLWIYLIWCMCWLMLAIFSAAVAKKLNNEN